MAPGSETIVICRQEGVRDTLVGVAKRMRRQKVRFADGIARTVDWYRANEAWWEPIRSGEYRDYYERQYGRSLSG